MPQAAHTPSGAGTADDFRFSHILIHDTAYARLLKRTRARLHERFAAWLTDTSRSRLAEYEEFVGYHLEQSFRYRGELGPIDDHGWQPGDEASRYLSSAGRRALARGDLPAAAGLLQRAAALLGENDPARALLLLDADEAAVDIGELERAESMLAEAVDRALSTDDVGTARAAALALLQLRYTTDAHAVQKRMGRSTNFVSATSRQCGGTSTVRACSTAEAEPRWRNSATSSWPPSRRSTRQSSKCSPGIWPPPSRSCARTTGVLRR